MVGSGGGGGGARSELAMPGHRSISLRSVRSFRTYRYHPATQSTASAWFLDAVRNTTRSAWPRRKKKKNERKTKL